MSFYYTDTSTYGPSQPPSQFETGFEANSSVSIFDTNLHDHYAASAALECPIAPQHELIYTGEIYNNNWQGEYTREEGVTHENVPEFTPLPEQPQCSVYEGCNLPYPESDNHSQNQQYLEDNGEVYYGKESNIDGSAIDCDEPNLVSQLIAQQKYQEMMPVAKWLPNPVSDMLPGTIEGYINPSTLMKVNDITYSESEYPIPSNFFNLEYSNSMMDYVTVPPKHTSTSPSTSTSSASYTSEYSYGIRRDIGMNAESHSGTTPEKDIKAGISEFAATNQRRWLSIIKNILYHAIQEGKQRYKNQKQQWTNSPKNDGKNKFKYEGPGPYFCPMAICNERYHSDATLLARHWGCVHIARSSELLPEDDKRRLELIRLQRCTNYPVCNKILSRPDSLGRHLQRNACGTRAQEKEYDEGY